MKRLIVLLCLSFSFCGPIKTSHGPYSYRNDCYDVVDWIDAVAYNCGANLDMLDYIYYSLDCENIIGYRRIDLYSCKYYIDFMTCYDFFLEPVPQICLDQFMRWW